MTVPLFLAQVAAYRRHAGEGPAKLIHRLYREGHANRLPADQEVARVAIALDSAGYLDGLVRWAKGDATRARGAWPVREDGALQGSMQ
jgi:hypothetical protein